MPLPTATPNELINTLKHSSLPTLIVEGKDDVIIYRWLRKRLSNDKMQLLQCYGRKNLLKIYEEREQFKHITTVFLADLDTWTFTDIPEQYQEIIFTNGYSIENDIYSGFPEELEMLMEQEMTVEFKEKLERLTEWYAFEVENHLKGNDFTVNHAIQRIFEKPSYNNLCALFLESRNFIEPDKETIDFIKENNYLRLRGKLITELLVKLVLKSQGYKSHQIFDILLKFGESNPYINKTIENINAKIQLEISNT